MKVQKLDFDRVHEERFRSLRAGVKIWRVPKEGKAEPIPLN
jgi:hypothetical protein